MGYNEGLDKLRGQHYQNLIKKVKNKIDRAAKTGEGKAEDLDEIDLLVLQTKDHSCFYKNKVKDTPVFKTPFKDPSVEIGNAVEASSSTTTTKTYSYVVENPLDPVEIQRIDEQNQEVMDTLREILNQERDEMIAAEEEERERNNGGGSGRGSGGGRVSGGGGGGSGGGSSSSSSRGGGGGCVGNGSGGATGNINEISEGRITPPPIPSTSKVPPKDGVRRHKKKNTNEVPEGTMDFDEFRSKNSKISGEDIKKIEYEVLLAKKRKIDLENERLEKGNEGLDKDNILKDLKIKRKELKIKILMARYENLINNNDDI